MKKISIIVPAFNAEANLGRCVDSLLNQTIGDTEIILVDDGSTDKTPELCDYYADTYESVKVIHQTNGGPSNARNAGIENASGLYIGFADADDDTDPEMFRKLYEKAVETKADYVFCDYIRITRSSEKYFCSQDIGEGFYPKEKIRQILYPQLIMKETIDHGPCLPVWNGIYRRQFLDDSGIRFDPDIRWTEDHLFSAMAVYSYSSLYYLKNEYLYHYCENRGSITTSYRRGAWDVSCILNQRFHRFFDSVPDYDFSRQINLSTVYYALNCIQQEKKNFGPASGKEIHRILHSDELQKALTGLQTPPVCLKLKILLFFMRIRADSMIGLYCRLH